MENLSSSVIQNGQSLLVNDPNTVTKYIEMTKSELAEASRKANEQLKALAEANKGINDRVVEVDADYVGSLIKTYWNKKTGGNVSLSNFASRYGVTVDQLRQWNPIMRDNYVRADQETAISDPETGNPANLGKATKKYLVIADC